MNQKALLFPRRKSHVYWLRPDFDLLDVDLKEVNTIYCKFGNFRENFFSRIALKDIFTTLKIRDKGMIYLHQ